MKNSTTKSKATSSLFPKEVITTPGTNQPHQGITQDQTQKETAARSHRPYKERATQEPPR